MTSEASILKGIGHIGSASVESEQATIALKGPGSRLDRTLAAGLRLESAIVQLQLAADALLQQKSDH